MKNCNNKASIINNIESSKANYKIGDRIEFALIRFT